MKCKYKSLIEAKMIFVGLRFTIKNHNFENTNTYKINTTILQRT